MRLALCLSVLFVVAGCDVFGSDPGDFEATLSGDRDSELSGTASLFVTDEGARIYLRSESGYDLRIETSADAFEPGTYSVSLNSVVQVVAPRLLTDAPRGVSGTVTITAASASEVSGSLDVGLAPFGTDPSQFVVGTFRAAD